MPSSPSRKAETPRGQILLRHVEELIDQSSGEWDEVLIRDIFNPIDVGRILSIPLSEHMNEDFVAWHKTRSYTFSVRSAYYTEWNHQNGHRLTRSDGRGTSTINPVWEILWKLQIPSKVKIFMWKALHGIVPVMSILANRHIPVSGQCPICKLDAEDIAHLLFKCCRAREVWLALGVLHVIDNALIVDRSGSVGLEEILRSQIHTPDNLKHIGMKELIAVGAWYIWWQRREAVKGENVAPPDRTSFAIQALTLNYKGAATGATPHEISWSRPASGT